MGEVKLKELAELQMGTNTIPIKRPYLGQLEFPHDPT